MSKVLITSLLAFGIGMAATASGNAVVSSAAGERALTPLDTVQLAQVGNAPDARGRVRVTPRGTVVAPRVVAPRGFVPRANVGAPRVVGRPAFVGRPGVVGRPVGVVGRPAFVGRSAFVRPYRPFYRRPWFGTVLGGVALGTFLTVATVGMAPAYAPAPGLCWYWADPSLTQGYWDYCQAPY